jgi:hypothetical protein
MKKAIITTIFAALVGIIYADNEGLKSSAPAEVPAQSITLTGCVIDFNSGEALTGVEVKIDGTDIKAYTDFDGNFEIPNVKPGKYNLIASYISYNNSLVEDFNLEKKENQVNIKMQPSN